MVIKDLKKEITSLIGARDAQLLITGILNMSVTDYIIKDSTEVSKMQVSEIEEYAEHAVEENNNLKKSIIESKMPE